MTGSSPMMALQSVVLPMPLRPMTDTASWVIRRSTPCSTCACP